MSVSRLAPDAFEKALVLSYQRDSAEAHRMMADIAMNWADLCSSPKSCRIPTICSTARTMRRLSA